MSQPLGAPPGLSPQDADRPEPDIQTDAQLHDTATSDDFIHIRSKAHEVSTQADRENQLVAAITRWPGAHLRQLHRITNIPLGSTSRALQRLESRGDILGEEIDAYRRYYPREGIHSRERIVLAHVATDKSRRILAAILAEPGIHHKELHTKVGIPGPTLSYYVSRLERDKVILARERKNRRSFRIKNDVLVNRALERWTPPPVE